MIRRLISTLILVLTLTIPGNALAGESFPAVISLPDGFQPEGIAIGRGTTFFVGSIPTSASIAVTCAAARATCSSSRSRAGPPSA